MGTKRYKYPYIETGSIRLLTVLSTSPEVRIEVEAVPLRSRPSYNALSYLWGNSRPFKRITVGDGYVDITENLSEFFSHMGQFVGERIWIDALSINQLDDAEKSRQVAQMADVYEQASKVIVWLGTEGEDSDWALEGIERYGQAAFDAGLLRLERNRFEVWPDVGDDPESLEMRERVQALIEAASEAEADPDRAAERFPRLAFAALTQREYFNRVWVKQEVTLARNAVIICGDRSTDADLFHTTCLFYGLLVMWENEEFRSGRQMRVPGPFSLQKLMSVPDTWILIKKTVANPAVGALFSGRRRQQQDPETKQPLRELLHTSYVRSGAIGLQSTDPRDKIFGLLGMVSDAVDLGIRADYSKETDKVYEEVARALISRQGHVDMLKWCCSRRRNPPTWLLALLKWCCSRRRNPPTWLLALLKWCRFRQGEPPSWVPDFRSNIIYTWTDEVGTPLFNATGSRKQPQVAPGCNSATSISTDDSCIRLEGIDFDTIAEIGSSFTHTDAATTLDQVVVMTMFSELRIFLITKSSYPKESFLDALWRIPICDKELHPTSAYFQRATDRSKKQFDLLNTQRLVDKVIGQTMSYQLAMQYQDGARPFVTKGGLVGLGPKEAKAGDVVSLLFGGSVPFVLSAVGTGRYSLVGEAYVHGIMDGEAMEKGLQEVVFELQ